MEKSFFLHNPFNRLIINGCGHFAYQLLLAPPHTHTHTLSFKIKSGKLARQERLSQSKAPAVRDCSSLQLHINAAITTASVDVNFLFICLYLVGPNGAVGACVIWKMAADKAC